MADDLKQGATFAYLVELSGTDSEGEPVDFSAWTATSEVHIPDAEYRDSLNVEVFAAGAAYCALLTKPDTSAWPVGIAFVDALLVSPSGQRLPTDTLRFNVVEPVTRRG